jgi:uncharacterized membrane protein YeaQ/YmgE (transglycosylase-associated protein family)
MGALDLLVWIALGAAAGFAAQQITKRPRGLAVHVAAGLLGALNGGFLFTLVGAGRAGGLLWTGAGATAGAVVLLIVVDAVLRRSA